MSLRAVHLFVITLATLALLGMCAWCLHERAVGQEFPGLMPAAIACAAAGLTLIGYAVLFLRKTRGVSLL